MSLGAIVGVAIVGQTVNPFVLEDIKQYAAPKAIGVRNLRLRVMTLCQAAFVGVIGYALPVVAAAIFFSVWVAQRANALGGLYLLPEVAVGVAAPALLIVTLSTRVSIRRVLRVDLATIFRG